MKSLLESIWAKVFFNDVHVTDEAVNEVLDILSSRKNHLNIIHAARSAKARQP